MFTARVFSLAAVCALAAGCSDDGPSASWQTVFEAQPASLLSVWPATHDNVYVVGGDARDGKGPAMLHYDGSAWTRIATGLDRVDLWWTFGFADGTVYASGSAGTILRYKDGQVTSMPTPGAGTSVIVFGLWGAAPNDMWAVGGISGGGGSGFVWHYDGTAWTARADLPADVPTEHTVFKVNGRSSTDVWMVGSGGLCLHWNGTALERSTVNTDGSLISVAAMDDRMIAVGGNFDGVLYENADNSAQGWQSALAAGGPVLSGVAGRGKDAYAVGRSGTVLHRGSNGWAVEDTKQATLQNLHATAIDDAGGVWAVGGSYDEVPTKQGVLIHRGNEPIGDSIP